MSWFSRLFRSGSALAASSSPIYLTNTLGGKKELFVPLKPPVVTLYSCGPTVYGRAHIGNMRSYVFSDTLARVLAEAGYHVRRVINITDVGHLVGDGDHGEDKMEKGARAENKTPAEIAEQYTRLFLEDIRALNIETPDILFPRATEYIKEQIAMIATLEEKGFAYRAEDGIYYDTSKFPNYGALGGVSGAKLLPGARIEKIRGKKNATDFVLWRDAKPNDLQQWDSPWGRGNPGWHIECSAMSRSLLGSEIDIHTGGIDHIPVHHNNEIAQSEGVSGRRFVRYWLHNAFLNIGEERIAKSLHNEITVSDLAERGYDPLSLRYLFLQAHYRSPISFSWESLEASAEALTRLWRLSFDIKKESEGKPANSDDRETFIALMRDDLLSPQALGILWEGLRGEDLSPNEKWGLLTTADALLGLSLTEPPEEAMPRAASELPEDIQKLVYERDLARGARDFAKADDLRYQLEKRGYRVEDSASGTLLTEERR